MTPIIHGRMGPAATLRFHEEVNVMERMAWTRHAALSMVLALVASGCGMTTIPLVNITGSGEHPWVWPYFLDGQPTVIAFWSTNEMQCLRDVPAMKTLDSRETSVQLVTVVTGRDRGEIDKWLRREGIQYPVLLDLDETLARHLGVDAYPTFVLYDVTGKELSRSEDIRLVHNWFDRDRWLERADGIAPASSRGDDEEAD